MCPGYADPAAMLPALRFFAPLFAIFFHLFALASTSVYDHKDATAGIPLMGCRSCFWDAGLTNLLEHDKHAKANSARVRLMRLAEAAENLQQQAAVSIQAGKENEAKGLLLQKRQVMLALEKSKRRIEVLDKLSSKLSEAVSLKESQLIGNVASYSSVSTQDTNHPIRIISPKEDYEDSKDEDFEIPDSKLFKAEEPEKHQAERPLDYQLPANEWAGNIDFSVDDQKLNSLKGISSYSDFLDHIKEQLKQIETDLLTMLRISTLVLESEEKQKNTKVQLTLELLEDVSSIRRRIASIMQTETDDS